MTTTMLLSQITIVGTQQLLADHAVLGRLLLLGHVSATESYLRSIIVGLLNTCPLAKRHAGSQTIPFASVDYYDETEIAYGLFDGISLAGGQEIRRVLKKLLDADVPNAGVIAAILKKFDGLCHLRHAAVHAHGAIGTANATALGIVSSGQRLDLSIDLARLHEAAMICRSLVQEINQFLFDDTFDKWNRSGLLVRDYVIDRSIFITLYSLFRSTRDSAARDIRPKTAYENLLRR